MEFDAVPEIHFIEAGHECARTIAHAIDLLRTQAGFSKSSVARILVGPRLGASEPAWGVCLAYECETCKSTVFIALLPACARVTAIRDEQSDGKRIEIEIEKLDRATVGATGKVYLVNGSRIRAVEAQRINLPYELSEQDWRILHLVFGMMGDRDWAYRSLRKGLPNEYQEATFDWKRLDFSSVADRLAQGPLEIPPLKQIRYNYEKQYPDAPPPSIATISATLIRVGMRERRGP
jgi:hypothetical protein